MLFLGIVAASDPKHAPQPMREDHLLTAELESPTDRRACHCQDCRHQTALQAYRRQHGFDAISLMPTNLYGPNDNFDLEYLDALPALIRKFMKPKRRRYEAVTLWGTGKPRREFRHVDDLADAALILMQHYDEEEIINVGTGEDLTITELAELIRRWSAIKATCDMTPTNLTVHRAKRWMSPD
ncbi:MAG: NAD-dependent epimerase/dehydratase family protein [Fodinibius sp.]|nr:NAD-dependent epimerase/dehydratase family protein [Fodinibius sp.]